METKTVVSSYVRSNKREANVEPDNTITYVIGGSALTLLAIVFWQITLVVALSIGAVYGVRTIAAQNVRTEVVEAVTQPVDKPKRSYNKRLKVHNYATGKTIAV